MRVEIQATKRRRVFLALGALFALTAIPSADAISERVVHDEYTGLAIAGYDPVAYFLENKPRKGSVDHEVAWRDSYWWFLNEGNAAAFQNAPEAYMPAYGGYSPPGVAEGVARAGNPKLFLIHKGRLFLFASLQDQAIFANDPTAMSQRADEAWPSVMGTLAH